MMNIGVTEDGVIILTDMFNAVILAAENAKIYVTTRDGTLEIGITNNDSPLGESVTWCRIENGQFIPLAMTDSGQ